MNDCKTFTYLHIHSTCPLAELRSACASLMELVDDAGEGPAGTSLMIRLCDVQDWSDAEYELTRLIAAEYKNLDYAIDRTNRPTATFYVGPANKMISFSPPFLSLCASLDIEVWICFNDAKAG